MQKTIAYYAVCITDGRFEDGTASIAVSCGHLHRTEAAAERCKENLRGYDPKTRTESAKWYNSRILPVDRRGRHCPEPEPMESQAGKIRADGARWYPECGWIDDDGNEVA